MLGLDNMPILNDSPTLGSKELASYRHLQHISDLSLKSLELSRLLDAQDYNLMTLTIACLLLFPL